MKNLIYQLPGIQIFHDFITTYSEIYRVNKDKDIRKQLHCLTAANMTRCNLSTLFSPIVWDRSVRRGVTLLAPSS